jgi:hypothetical protein
VRDPNDEPNELRLESRLATAGLLDFGRTMTSCGNRRGLAKLGPSARRSPCSLVAVAQVQKDPRAGEQLGCGFELRASRLGVPSLHETSTFVEKRARRSLVLGLRMRLRHAEA